jgi:hypothetical protein
VTLPASPNRRVVSAVVAIIGTRLCSIAMVRDGQQPRTAGRVKEMRAWIVGTGVIDTAKMEMCAV